MSIFSLISEAADKLDDVHCPSIKEAEIMLNKIVKAYQTPDIDPGYLAKLGEFDDSLSEIRIDDSNFSVTITWTAMNQSDYQVYRLPIQILHAEDPVLEARICGANACCEVWSAREYQAKHELTHARTQREYWQQHLGKLCSPMGA